MAAGDEERDLWSLVDVRGVLYTNRTHTDQVGSFGRMAQGIGRRMLVAEVTQLFEAVQRQFGR